MKLLKAEGIKRLVVGKKKSLSDENLFHRLSLIAFFAWIGLGADGLSSSCYGPEETFNALAAHPALSIFVALASALTVFVISASYSQIIELFPTGGGGYLVASKLLSPSAGVVSGCALLIDYVLTITISIASGADAIFSMMPAHYLPYKYAFEIAGVALLTLMNLRGAKEAVLPWVPIFILFVATHAFAILYALVIHAGDLGAIVSQTAGDVRAAHSQLGWIGLMLLMLRAYSMGAGTYTGIEAVSNGLPLLREPRAETGKRTMRYMAFSLAITVAGLLIAYLLFHVKHVEGKTLNAVLFEAMTANWPHGLGFTFVMLTLLSEGALLFVAAQAGFLDGPRVLSNMALDRWFPSAFATLSDRFVTQKGILLMGGAALVMMVFTRGNVNTLVVLYSINVFITFTLSQLGMVRHWWQLRAQEPEWKKRISINGLGFTMTAFILCSLSIVKFREGGWVTLVVTGALVVVAFLIRRHYNRALAMLGRLNSLLDVVREEMKSAPLVADVAAPEAPENPGDKTAVLLVNGFNGLGLHTLMGIHKMFARTFQNFVFIEIGLLDAGNFKGRDELHNLEKKVRDDLAEYVRYMRGKGFRAAGLSSIGTDVIEEVLKLMPQITERHRNVIFFGGQLVFPNDTFVNRLLHNHTIFALQQRLFRRGLPLLILPIRV